VDLAQRGKRILKRHGWAARKQKKAELTTNQLICPACKSARVKRSRSQNAFERFIKRFNRKAYRCLDCGWRGIVAVPKPGPFKARNSREPRKINWLPIVIASLLLALFLIFYLTREPGPSNTGQNRVFPSAALPA
jgi:predicted RNA-binding Zn-ribbon protein involved in translation (DUF1610 family)